MHDLLDLCAHHKLPAFIHIVRVDILCSAPT
jgi:hypothetical protein